MSGSAFQSLMVRDGKSMVSASVVRSLTLVDYQPVQTHKPYSNYLVHILGLPWLNILYSIRTILKIQKKE